ncbi:MAG: hypothetical protein HN849_15085, partial [Victivallales bacterium]|nr:hypothetical protein [Victivallales bacterium]
LAEYSERVHLRWVRPAVTSLARSYLLTGDRRYARKAAIMLYRIAEEYGHMSHVIDDRARCDCGYPRVLPRTPLKRVTGNGWVGFFTDRIWENDNTVVCAQAYDDIFDALGDDDPELLAFVQAQRQRADTGPQRAIFAHLSRFPVPRTMAEFRQSIETNMLRVMAQGVLDRAISGNDGMHQNAMITLALVMGTPQARELVDWCYTGPGQMQFHLPNYFFRDGSAFESLGGYNSIHIRGLNAVVGKMERLRALLPDVFPPAKYPRITDQLRHRLLYDFPTRLVLAGSYSPMVGDTGRPADTRRRDPIGVGSDLKPRDYDSAFRLYGDPRYAQVLASARGGLPRPDLFGEPLDDAVAQALAETGRQAERETDVLDGYGLGILRSGEGESKRALAMFYGKLRGHAHDDFLDIGLVAHGLYPMQHLGYPRSWHHSAKWEKNWATHYRVGVAGPGADFRLKGAVRAVASVPGLQYIDVEGMPYRERKGGTFARWQAVEDRIYRRSCALVDLSATDFYVVDVFRVQGGSEHYWAFHALGKMATTGLDLGAPEPGTLAGPDVAYGESGKVKDRAKQAFALLEQVRRANPSGPWSCEWRLGDDLDTRLRFTMVAPDSVEALLAKGHSPSAGSPYEFDVVLAARSGKAPLASTFVSVIEIYKGGQRVLDTIETVPGGLRVTAGDRTDTILYERTPGVPFDGEFGLWTENAGRLSQAALVNGTVWAKNGAEVKATPHASTGEVVAVDREAGTLVVKGLTVGTLRPGEFLSIGNPDRRSCYRILEAEAQGGGVCLRLNDDPLVGEGDARSFKPGTIQSRTHFPLAGNRYYHGAYLTAPKQKRELRVASVSSGGSVFLAERAMPAAELRAFFGPGGRFRIYDYGVGDTVQLTQVAHLRAD